MTDANRSYQTIHMPLLKHVFNQAVAFALIKPAFAKGHHARSILATMLQYRQRIVNALVNVGA